MTYSISYRNDNNFNQKKTLINTHDIIAKTIEYDLLIDKYDIVIKHIL